MIKFELTESIVKEVSKGDISTRNFLLKYIGKEFYIRDGYERSDAFAVECTELPTGGGAGFRATPDSLGISEDEIKKELRKDSLQREKDAEIRLLRSKVYEQKMKTDWVSFRNSVALEYIKGTMRDVQLNNFKSISEQIKKSVRTANAVTDILIGANVFTGEPILSPSEMERLTMGD